MRIEPVVLIVDDDSFMRALLKRTFADAGIAAHAFASADELLAEAELDVPGVLLLDVRMPGMSGPELQKRLWADGVRLPVIFLTGYADVPVAVDAMRDGALDFLVKPFESEALVARVRATFARRYAAAPGRPLEHAQRLRTLTPREREVFDLMKTGMSSKLIARALDCSFRTIDIHRGRVMTKMAADSLAQLVLMTVEPRGAGSLRDDDAG